MISKMVIVEEEDKIDDYSRMNNSNVMLLFYDLCELNEKLLLSFSTSRFKPFFLDTGVYFTYLLRSFREEDVHKKYIDLLEETGKEFSKGNLMDEFSLIRENYVIGVSYFMNIASYISNKQDFKNTLDQHDSLARFSNNDTDCYNLIKINDDLLKKYRKEWRD